MSLKGHDDALLAPGKRTKGALKHSEVTHIRYNNTTEVAQT